MRSPGTLRCDAKPSRLCAQRRARLLASREQLLSVAELATWAFHIDFATPAVTWTPEFYRIVGLDPENTVPSLELGVLASIPTTFRSRVSHRSGRPTTDGDTTLQPDSPPERRDAPLSFIIEGDIDAEGKPHVVAWYKI